MQLVILTNPPEAAPGYTEGMEAIISDLLNRFEKGALSRRGLIQGLAMLTAAGAQAQDTAIKPTKIDHVSIQVTDLPQSIAFYQKIFGFNVVSEDKPNEIVRLGAAGKVLVSLHHKGPTGLVDHFAIGVEKLDAGFHIKDPEGISVQIMGPAA
jgi:Glyoxalase/Bleomycin resistance protein/Dioxygenase superfamily